MLWFLPLILFNAGGAEFVAVPSVVVVVSDVVAVVAVVVSVSLLSSLLLINARRAIGGAKPTGKSFRFVRRAAS